MALPIHAVVSALLSVCSVLVPSKLWYGPNKPIPVEIKATQPITLTLLKFDGTPQPASGSAVVAPSKNGPSKVNLEKLFSQMEQAGTYVLLAVPKGKPDSQFVGTPLVIEAIADTRAGAPPGVMVRRIEPLERAVITTAYGPVDCMFYYDVAPHTVDNFLRLTEQGYFTGLDFHRIVPGFVIQGGDPRGDGTGGPGYTIGQEFNDRPHHQGVLSMARGSDPDSAGSQFFVCLDYAQTQQLDHKYTAFGKVITGMDAVDKIAATPLADASPGKPETPQVMQQVQAFAVTAKHDPYAEFLHLKK